MPGAAPVIGTRSAGRDISQSQTCGVVQVEQFPAWTFVGGSPDLPAAEDMCTLRTDADAMHLHDPGEGLILNFQAFAAFQRGAGQRASLQGRCVAGSFRNPMIGQARHRMRPLTTRKAGRVHLHYSNTSAVRVSLVRGWSHSYPFGGNRKNGLPNRTPCLKIKLCGWPRTGTSCASPPGR